MAVIFSDDFVRADSASVGGDWSEHDTPGFLSIYSNKLRLLSSADNDAFIHVAPAGYKSNNIKITFTINFVTHNGKDFLSVSSKAPQNASYYGYGFIDAPNTGNRLAWNDNATTSNETAFTYTAGTTYNVEILIFDDYSGEIRVWDSAGSRPALATLSHAAETPTASGSNYQIGFNSGGTGAFDARIGDFVVTDYPDVTAPTVTTQAASSILATSFTGNGNITDTGGANATRRGFCYLQGSSGDPTVADSVAYDDGDFGTGAYTKGVTGLTAGTAYRVRAYAINSAGTSYGATVDVVTIFVKSLTDTGAGADTVSVKSSFTISDNGSGADSVPAIKNNLTVTDSGQGVDSATIKAFISLLDSGAGSEQVSTAINVLVSDLGLGVDAVADVKRGVNIQDSGVGNDLISLINSYISVLDSGAGTDALTINQFKTVLDNGYGVEGVSVLTRINVSDTGQGVDEVYAIEAKLTITDSGSGADAILTRQIFIILDTGLGTDAIASLLNQVRILDTGQGIDLVHVPTYYKNKYSARGTTYSDKFGIRGTIYKNKFTGFH